MKSFEILSMFAHKINSKDQDYIRLFWSIRNKMSIHNYFLSQIDEYFKIVKKEMNDWDGKGVKSVKNHNILLAYFEAILNNAYSIMESIAKITVPFFPKQDLPKNFHKQLSWFIKNENKELDKKYSDLLATNMGWYHELQEIRSEPVHYLTGTIVFDKDENGIYIPKYFNLIKSGRKKIAIKTESINVGIDFTHKIGKEISNFLEFYGQHFISEIDQESETTIMSLQFKNGDKVPFIKQVPVKLKYLLSGKVKINEIDAEKLPN